MTLIDVKAQYREKFEDEDNTLGNLALSIKAHGVLSPILLRPVPNGRFELVAGERRFRASKLAGLATIPCLIKTMTDVQAADAQLVENIDRLNLTNMEEARALKVSLDALGGNQSLLAKKFGKSPGWVSQRLSLLNLNPETKRLMSEGASADVTTIVGMNAIEKADPAGAKRLIEEAVATKGDGGSLRKVVEQANKDVKATGKVAPTTTKAAISAAAKPAGKAASEPSVATERNKAHLAPGLPFVVAKGGQAAGGSVFPAAPVKPHERVITGIATALAAPKAEVTAVFNSMTADDAKIANDHALPFFKRGKNAKSDVLSIVLKGLRDGEFGKDPVGLFNACAFAQGVSLQDEDSSGASLTQLLADMAGK